MYTTIYPSKTRKLGCLQGATQNKFNHFHIHFHYFFLGKEKIRTSYMMKTASSSSSTNIGQPLSTFCWENSASAGAKMVPDVVLKCILDERELFSTFFEGVAHKGAILFLFSWCKYIALDSAILL